MIDTQSEGVRLHDEALRYEGKHPDQLAARKAEAEREISLERSALYARARSEAAKRGYSFAPPAVPGSGWASIHLSQALTRVFAFAELKFLEVIEAEERVALAKRNLAGTASNSTPHPQLGELREERSRLDIREAQFEAALLECDSRREKLAAPETLAALETANAIEGAFESYIVPDMPEAEQIRTAVTSLVEVAASVRARHEAALARHSAAVVAARHLDIPRRELPETFGLLTEMAGINFVRATAKEAADAAGLRLFRNQRFRLEEWLPTFSRPAVERASDVRPVVSTFSPPTAEGHQPSPEKVRIG